VYTKHDNLVDADTSGVKANTKHLESRLKVIQGHAFWDRWKADDGLRIYVPRYKNVGFRGGSRYPNVADGQTTYCGITTRRM